MTTLGWLPAACGVLLAVIVSAGVGILLAHVSRGRRGGLRFAPVERSAAQQRLDDEQLDDANVRRLALEPEATVVISRAALRRCGPPHRPASRSKDE